MYPGTYIFSGGLSTTYTIFNLWFPGYGVTLFFTSGGGYGYGTVSFTNSTLNLSAPTSNTYGGIPGVLIMSDRNWVHTGVDDFSLNGSTVSGDGVWYLTGSGLSVTSTTNSGVTTTSSMSAPNYLAFDVDNLSVTSSSTINLSSNFSSISGGSPLGLQGGLVQ